MKNKTEICKKRGVALLLEIDATTYPAEPKHFYKCSLALLMRDIETNEINAREETKKILEEKFSLCKSENCKYADGKKIMEAYQLSFPFKQKI